MSDRNRSPTSRFLVFAAALRASSLNRKLAAAAARVAEESGAVAFIISSPEHNASMPGMLKNLIDWVSRFKPQPFGGKHGLLLSASPSMAGGNRGLWALRVRLERLARIYPDMFSLAQAHTALVDVYIADGALRARFDDNVRAFLSLAEFATHYPCMRRAWVEFLGEPPSTGADRVDPVPL